MEIVTAVNLWKDYNHTALPLDVRIINVSVDNGVEYTEAYFSAHVYEHTACVRVYCRLAKMIGVERAPVVLIADDIDMHLAQRDINKYLAQGFCVFQYDYLGKREGYNKYTLYPTALSYCNHFVHPSAINKAVSVPQSSCWYEWSIIAFRTMAMIAHLLGDVQVSVVGIGLGGAHAFKVAALHRDIASLVVKYDADLFLSSDKANVVSLVAFSSSSYAPAVRTPTLLELASNESDGSFDHMAELYAAIGTEYLDEQPTNTMTKRLAVSESRSHDIGPVQRHNEMLWLMDAKQKRTVPDGPTLQKKISEGNIYFTVMSADYQEIQSVEIYVATDESEQATPAYRYWSLCKTEHLGVGEYLGKVKAEPGIVAYWAFANVLYKGGYCFSTPLYKTTMPISASALRPNRLVYDSDMQIDNWMVLSREALSHGGVEMTVGPFDIAGVTGLGGELTCFKIGDSRFRGAQGSIMQLSLYSKVAQELVFVVISRQGLKEFRHKTNISLERNWTKISLSENDFKGVGKLNWQDALSIRINSATPIVLSNVLWA